MLADCIYGRANVNAVTPTCFDLHLLCWLLDWGFLLVFLGICVPVLCQRCPLAWLLSDSLSLKAPFFLFPLAIKSVKSPTLAVVVYIRLVFRFPGGTGCYTQFTMSSFLSLPGLTSRPSSFYFQTLTSSLTPLSSLPPSLVFFLPVFLLSFLDL